MLEILRNRRSVRKFTDQPIEEDKINLLTEALVRSPSSRSINPWEFVFVGDRETIGRLSRCKPHGAGFLAGALLAVVIVGDTASSDTCIEDCSIAAITLQYAAESLGLKSCWCQVRLREHGDGKSAEDYVRELVGIPENYLVECIVGIGYPGEGKEGHDRESLDWGKVHRNTFSEQ
ncbi:MAG: nitroreductase family protein [bacterium]|nr:nitroreductase family protein [bacterium]MDT8367006.1 nitroreductase family protein [bacterium]